MIGLRDFDLTWNVVMSGEELIAKPDLRIYQILLDRYGLKADECVFIDDRQSNIDAAQAIGIHGITFKSCEQTKQAFHQIANKYN